MLATSLFRAPVSVGVAADVELAGLAGGAQLRISTATATTVKRMLF
jgi:hypothetical protein